MKSKYINKDYIYITRLGILGLNIRFNGPKQQFPNSYKNVSLYFVIIMMKWALCPTEQPNSLSTHHLIFPTIPDITIKLGLFCLFLLNRFNKYLNFIRFRHY